MPLQNRVTPDAQIISARWRGDFMGNRGGRIHDPETKTLLSRKWASRRWIICVTKFKGRHRELMGKGYTELFFLDEVSALAAGHRPCFECRRQDAKAYANAWITSNGKPDGSLADGMDKLLHQERTQERGKLSKSQLMLLPDGAMVKINNRCFAKKGDQILEWLGEGYKASKLPKGEIHLLTPPYTIEALKNGYQPSWHRSAL